MHKALADAELRHSVEGIAKCFLTELDTVTPDAVEQIKVWKVLDIQDRALPAGDALWRVRAAR